MRSLLLYVLVRTMGKHPTYVRPTRSRPLGVFSPFWGPAPCALVLGLLLLLTSPPAVAADSASDDEASRVAARALGTDGVKAFQAENYELASTMLEDAYHVLEVPSLGLWSARALEKTGRLVEASERYLEATRLPVGSKGDSSIQEESRAQAATERAALMAKIPTVTIQLIKATPSQVRCSINEQEINPAFLGKQRPTNPGVLEIVVKRGTAVLRKTVRLAEGEHEQVEFDFSGFPEPRATSSSSGPGPDQPTRRDTWKRPAGWASLAVGAAALGVGGALAGVMAGKKRDLSCTGRECDAPQEQIDDFNDLRLPTTICFISGGILVATGVTFLLLPRHASHARAGGLRRVRGFVSPYISPSAAGVRGAF